MRHAAGSAVVVSGWHRMGNTFTDRPVMSRELERHIRILHALVGNVYTEGKFILLGTGSTQLLNAAVHAFSPDNSSDPAKVVASIPFDPVCPATCICFVFHFYYEIQYMSELT